MEVCNNQIGNVLLKLRTLGLGARCVAKKMRIFLWQFRFMFFHRLFVEPETISGIAMLEDFLLASSLIDFQVMA
jgi:hypothetical protein